MLWARQRTGAPVPAHHGAFHILLADDSGEDSSSSAGDPRDRARAGRRRRKQLNASIGKKIRRNAGYLAHVAGVCVTMFTSHTAGIVGGPLSDVWAVVKPRHHTTPTTRAAMMFCGRARSWKTRRRGAAHMPRDLLYGHDLRKPAVWRRGRTSWRCAFSWQASARTNACLVPAQGCTRTMTRWAFATLLCSDASASMTLRPRRPWPVRPTKKPKPQWLTVVRRVLAGCARAHPGGQRAPKDEDGAARDQEVHAV